MKNSRPLERRTIRSVKPDVTDEGKIRGLAIPFEQWTTIGSGALSFREKVATGAVTKTFQEGDVVLLDNHDPAKPIARKSAGTLEVRVGADGARYEATPADTTYARDCAANIRAGNYGGMSFGFEVVKEKWDIGDDGIDERTLLEIKTPEISVCTFPAYAGTEVGMRDAYMTGMEARNAYYEERGGDAPGDGSKPYGNVTYADPGYQADKKKRYPVDTKKHVKAAWSYINKAKNAAKYTASQVASIKAKIKSAAKKVGVTIGSDRDYSDFDLRGYKPTLGFVAEVEETRDDPDGLEIAAMREAVELLQSGDSEGAQKRLQDSLDHFAYHNPNSTDADDDNRGPDGSSEYGEDSSGMTAHTNKGGAAVPVRSNGQLSVVVEARTIQRAYDLVRELPVTPTSNEVLDILAPLLEAAEETPADDGQRSNPKPESSTSGIALDSDLGRALAREHEALSQSYRR